MPNAKDITLLASAARTTGGTGTAQDVGDRTYTEVTLDVTAITGTLVVTIEASPSQSSWTALGFFHNVTTTGVRTLIVPDGHRYLRAVWSGSFTATFVITARSHQLYSLPKDVLAVGGSVAKAAASIPVVEIANACLAASSEAEGYLASANTLPITSLDEATRRHICRMAVFELFRDRPGSAAASAQSSSGAAMIEVGRSEAVKWLSSVASGKVRPPGLVDSTPDVPEAGSGTADLYVVTAPRRGW